MAEASAQDDSEETDLVERLLKMMFSADFFKPQNISRLSSTWCGNFQTSQTSMYIS